jgi:hypothetical protein
MGKLGVPEFSRGLAMSALGVHVMDLGLVVLKTTNESGVGHGRA